MKFKWIIEWRGLKIPSVGIIIFGISLFFSLGMILAPLSLPADSVGDLTGKVGTVENEDITEDMNPYAKFFYDSGDSNCHTIKERSFFVNGNQMPFCARDMAIFFGMTLGLLFALFIRVPLKWWWLIGGLIPIGIDGTVQLFTPYESTNLMRVLTGGLAGIVTSLALGWVIYDVSQVANIRHEVPLGGDMDGGPMGDYPEQKEEPVPKSESPVIEEAPLDNAKNEDGQMDIKGNVKDKT
jgi:uncharacterized membrane protein